MMYACGGAAWAAQGPRDYCVTRSSWRAMHHPCGEQLATLPILFYLDEAASQVVAAGRNR
eukprot:7149843-Pyramimonas_sp.AAC.1